LVNELWHNASTSNDVFWKFVPNDSSIRAIFRLHLPLENDSG